MMTSTHRHNEGWAETARWQRWQQSRPLNAVKSAITTLVPANPNHRRLVHVGMGRNLAHRTQEQFNALVLARDCLLANDTKQIGPPLPRPHVDRFIIATTSSDVWHMSKKLNGTGGHHQHLQTLYAGSQAAVLWRQSFRLAGVAVSSGVPSSLKPCPSVKTIGDGHWDITDPRMCSGLKLD